MRADTKVVILGAGFGGVAAAQELSRLTGPDQCEITIVDRNNYLLFTPLLTEVAGGNVDTEDVAVPVRGLTQNVTFLQGNIIHLDLDHKQVTVDLGGREGIPEATRTLSADHVVIALGSETNFHGIPGLEQNSLTIKSMDEAAEIRTKALALMERANAEEDPVRRRGLGTFVVAGGGFSGVETMAALNDLVHDAVQTLENLPNDEVRTILVHPGERLLPELDERLATYAQTALEKRGVKVVTGTEVKGATKQSIQVDPAIDGEDEIPAHLLVWAAGVKPSPVVERAAAKLGPHKGLVVDRCCRVAGRPGIWALGDCAEVPKSSNGATYAPTAQNASREGALVARNIAAVMTGGQPRTFDYKPIGELAIVGRRTGVASLYGIKFSGLPAWILWRLVYLSKMPTNMKRMRVGVSWLADLVFGRDSVELSSGAR